MTREEAKSCIGTIEMLQRLAYNIHGVMDVIDADNCKKIIEALEQEPKVGEWLEKEVSDKVIEEWQSARCSVCDRYHTTPYMYYFSNYKFCPNCGARMEVSE